MKRTVIHRGPIPGTDVGHHWFEDPAGAVYGVIGGNDYGNKGWGYEIVDREYRHMGDGFFNFVEIRDWAESIQP